MLIIFWHSIEHSTKTICRYWRFILCGGGGVGICSHSELDALTPFQKVGIGDVSKPHFSTRILKIYIHSQQLISKKLGHEQQVEERSDLWSVPQDNWKQLIEMTECKRSILTGSVNQVVHQFVNNCVGSYSNSLRTTFSMQICKEFWDFTIHNVIERILKKWRKLCM